MYFVASSFYWFASWKLKIGVIGWKKLMPVKTMTEKRLVCFVHGPLKNCGSTLWAQVGTLQLYVVDDWVVLVSNNMFYLYTSNI